MDKIHFIARAYIRDEDYILIADTGTHLFLPGGHVKYKESMHSALLRELREEMMVTDLKIGNFIGVVENIWGNSGNPFHEFCAVFQVASNNFLKSREIKSKEAHLKFYWTKFNQLEKLGFLPKGIYSLLKQYEKISQPSFLSLI
ncbi:NUDIX domain-containing protein [Candidatus Cardinium hertigii]|jgi:ADP-ribose pyrophosphatase YjhB (NUDIX family)|uniref:NUDIX domain-containing protein n=1 Tax=Candidatus Cardinium hertigii TaxID=247481 RepID=A0A3N2QBG0_9BACT|nr:NUDIX domain-containing protein [Candidatus Cardinium hertigii]ROT47101.1 NUDIX domain-containing protein [Candidatus Cardinium hertigii]ROT47424.1 NUDIX domain-containing protein [Candidatus Cardinium hertigii]